MRELGDGEDEHQIEEQLDKGDARMVVAVPGPEQMVLPSPVIQCAFSTAAQAAGSFGR